MSELSAQYTDAGLVFCHHFNAGSVRIAELVRDSNSRFPYTPSLQHPLEDSTQANLSGDLWHPTQTPEPRMLRQL